MKRQEQQERRKVREVCRTAESIMGKKRDRSSSSNCSLDRGISYAMHEYVALCTGLRKVTTGSRGGSW